MAGDMLQLEDPPDVVVARFNWGYAWPPPEELVIIAATADSLDSPMRLSATPIGVDEDEAIAQVLKIYGEVFDFDRTTLRREVWARGAYSHIPDGEVPVFIARSAKYTLKESTDVAAQQ